MTKRKLVPCPDCAHQVSKKAKTCPNCGTKLPRRAGLAGTAIVLFIAFCVFANMIGGSVQPSAPVAKLNSARDSGLVQSSPSQEAGWIYESKKNIKEQLKDADSAEFRDVFFNMAKLEGKDIPVVCGEVNSKNGFGGFSGYQKFVATGLAGVVAFEQQVSDFHNLWNKMCI